MDFRFSGFPQVNEKDLEFLETLNLEEIEPYFIEPEIKGLKSDVEDIHLLCVHKPINNDAELTEKKFTISSSGKFLQTDQSEGRRLRKIVHIDINEQSNSGAAQSEVNPQEIEQKCPQKDYYRVWFHTHTHSISAQSTDDRLAGFKLSENNVGDAMCAVGINGVNCHLYNGKKPIEVRSLWNSNFWDQLKSMGNLVLLPLQNSKLEIEKENEIKLDQVMCTIENTKNAKSFDCIGRNWENGINSYPIGRFDSLAIDGSIDFINDGNQIGIASTPLDRKYECVSLVTESSGKKLICR